MDKDILKNYKRATKLNACNIHKITNINHMTKLKELDASHDCGIDDEGIIQTFNTKKELDKINSDRH